MCTGLDTILSKACANTVCEQDSESVVTGATVAERAVCSCWKVSKLTKGVDQSMRRYFAKVLLSLQLSTSINVLVGVLLGIIHN